jgi:hypothetical protein
MLFRALLIILMYNRPLCTKCLHLVDLHTVILADYPDVVIKRCAVGICRCIMSVRKKTEGERKKTAMPA